MNSWPCFLYWFIRTWFEVLLLLYLDKDSRKSNGMFDVIENRRERQKFCIYVRKDESTLCVSNGLFSFNFHWWRQKTSHSQITDSVYNYSNQVEGRIKEISMIILFSFIIDVNSCWHLLLRSAFSHRTSNGFYPNEMYLFASLVNRRWLSIMKKIFSFTIYIQLVKHHLSTSSILSIKRWSNPNRTIILH